MENKKLFQIGDVAKMFHISVGSLRHYEQAGLLKPEYTDPETGYRYYSVRQFARFGYAIGSDWRVFGKQRHRRDRR